MSMMTSSFVRVTVLPSHRLRVYLVQSAAKRCIWTNEEIVTTMASESNSQNVASTTNNQSDNQDKNNNSNISLASGLTADLITHQQQQSEMIDDEDPLLISQSLTYVTDDGGTLLSFQSAPFSAGEKSRCIEKHVAVVGMTIYDPATSSFFACWCITDFCSLFPLFCLFRSEISMSDFRINMYCASYCLNSVWGTRDSGWRLFVQFSIAGMVLV